MDFDSDVFDAKKGVLIYWLLSLESFFIRSRAHVIALSSAMLSRTRTKRHVSHNPSLLVASLFLQFLHFTGEGNSPTSKYRIRPEVSLAL